MKFISPRHTSLRQSEDTFVHRILDDQYVDWLLIMAISAVLVFVCAGFGWYTYSGVRARLDAKDSQDVVSRISFDETALRHVLSGFEARSVEREQAIRGYAGVGDPAF